MTAINRRGIIEHAIAAQIEESGWSGEQRIKMGAHELSLVVERAINEFEIQSPAESDWMTGLHDALAEAGQKISNADQIGALTAIHQALSLLPPVRPKPDALRGSARGFFARLIERRSA